MANHEPSAASDMPQIGQTNVRLEVLNFGPVARASIQLRPLTVFVGPSNTGKTYLALLIYALHRVFEGFPPLPLFMSRYMYISSSGWRPVEVPKEALEEVLEKLSMGREIRFSGLPSVIRDELLSGIRKPELAGSGLWSELRRCFDVESQSELIRRSSFNRFSVSLNVSDLSRELWQFAMISSNIKLSPNSIEHLLIKKPHDDKPLVNGDIQNILLKKGGEGKTNNKIDEAVNNMLSRLEREERIYPLDWYQFMMLIMNLEGDNNYSLNNTAFYLPAVRGGIMQSHRIIASALVARSTRVGFEDIPQIPTFSGSVADFMQELILYDEHREDPKRSTSKQISNLAKDLEKGILSGDIVIEQSITGGYPEFVYCPRGTQQNIRLNRASSMVSELTPIVLLMRGHLKPGDTLIIEEPEAHLHPAAQTQMARTLAALVRAGVRVLVTTHSDWLLQEMANLVREGELRQAQEKDSEPDASSPWLAPEEVGVWLFKDSQDGGGATVKEIPFDRVDGLEPEDYADVAETLYNDSAKLQNQLEMIRSQGGVTNE